MKATQKKLLNLFLLGFVGVLAAWLLFYTLGQKEEKEAEKKEAVRVLPRGISVVGLTLETPDERFALERTGDDWRLTEPLSTAAEKSTIDGMVNHIVGLEQIRRVGKKNQDGEIEPPEELWLFALEPPRFTVTLTDADGDQVRLLVGKKNTFDGSIYVKLEDGPDVLQVDGALEYQIDNDLYQLRDKRLVAFDEAAVTRLSVSPATGEPYVVERDGEEFVVVAPRRLAADRAQVTGMLSALANVRAKEFVSEHGTEEERKRLGLDRPTVRVELASAGVEHEIWLTEQKQGNDVVYYAMRAGDHPIVQLSSNWVFQKVNISLESLRDKRVLRFDREAVQGITLARGEARLVFTKTRDAEAERDRWRMVEPEAGDADGATIAGILYRLSTLKAKTVIKEQATDEDFETAGLTEPETTIELTGTGDAVLATARFTEERGGERLATGGQRIDLIEASAIGDLSFEPGDYRAAQPEESEE